MAAEDEALERDRFQSEKAFREREVLLLERNQSLREEQLELKRAEAIRPRWSTPLVLAILAATVAAAGNAGVAFVNGVQQRALERQKSENSRILEMIKTGDPDSAANNLQFLIDSGLVADSTTRASLEEFIKNRSYGTGPSLPTLADTLRKIKGSGNSVTEIPPSGIVLKAFFQIEAPSCLPERSLPQTLEKVPQELSADQQIEAAQEYERYKIRCAAFLAGEKIRIRVQESLRTLRE